MGWDDSLYGMLNLVVTLVGSAPATGWQLEIPTTDRPWSDYLRARWRSYAAPQTEGRRRDALAHVRLKMTRPLGMVFIWYLGLWA